MNLGVSLRKSSSWLWGIIILGFLLRVIVLQKIPVGFTPDEASFGYDAYSLLKTGQDQWGHFLPLTLESFGDFKAPLYTYLTIPSVAIFGLTKFATRFPNALLGSAAVYITYLLVVQLLNFGFRTTGPKRYLQLTTYPPVQTGNLRLGLVVAFLLAISPWHIMLSRGAFEANLTTFFLPLSTFLFLKGIKDFRFLIPASITFGLNLFTYHSARLVTPLMILFLILLFRREFKLLLQRVVTNQSRRRDRFVFALEDRLMRAYIFSVIICLIFITLVVYTFTEGAGRRVQDVSIFRGALEAQAAARLITIEGGVNPVLARLMHNKYQIVAKRFIDTYRQFFSVKFLFKNGAGETTYGMLPGTGVLYWFETPFLIGFLIYILKNPREKIGVITLFWILVATIPASLTTGKGYAANRVAIMMPAIQIASALGVTVIIDILNKRMSSNFTRIVLLLYFFIVLLSFGSFLKKYFLLSPQVASKGMLYGNLEVATWLGENSEDKLKIIVSRKLSEPHIYIAFANKWDPKDYQNYSKDWNRYKDKKLAFLDQLDSYFLGKYVFQTIEPRDLNLDSTTFLVGRPGEFPDGMNIVNKISYPNNDTAILVVEPFGELYAKTN
ncbi:hypothetical protein A2686_04615 [Candidatus Woesebacteria bacterium RIFCSPHIGHO2_01_FULL_38_10]|uniref:Glycosyltransferase RgtA/B/C/D-like domain-containing protein n=1 Tax=Candidatus Woesebacteria bacterium RIFCSPLOWO2_01_FULL_39_10b TaxID=1802517 RepID=A0A1F8B9B9_9BACT|nr:MAG: hypothetical protein A2686_04615 [Candidatus Woesebacteria bacterium RIFCSPHIGHO2_01_FULL_38_10]OGM60621.1 MAG: hypothetical protein A2892_01075 [Candidatus Woesebacteria bacterium RIFCSPLOWO2_01_FULL_39_10b]